ncbi:unnamed protein product [Arabis nemorensis]|uniref:F-box domain-containing protein n=1 Tax=Arabis nemorensis TaxID=586526 RepID=A0A565B421_9BRAS|nr:unnamed protein product [Arabis nemorensis]
MSMIDSKEKTDSNDDSTQPVLVMDLIRSILDRLSFADFCRARCISSDWYSASKSSIRGITNPWLIFFPKVYGEIKNDTCKFFNPRDNNFYTVRDQRFDFAWSYYFASSGSWFLMYQNRILHLLNVFTRERIPLPSLESLDGSEVIVMRKNSFVIYATLDYKGKDRRNNGDFLAYHKSGDNNNNESWKVLQHLKKNEGCVDMVFNESKLYVLRVTRRVTVFDFSGGDSPMECASYPSPMECASFKSRDDDVRFSNNLAVTLSGEVLIISGRVEYPWINFQHFRRSGTTSGRYFFNMYKLDPKSSEWRIIESLGEEALLLDQGITVAAQGGVVKNCIYFSNGKLHGYDGYKDANGICNCVYNIKTKKMFKVFEHLTASDARWFFPTFGGE